jgi:predicted membrane channel-forming protein YqfA (hemolysin III family)
MHDPYERVNFWSHAVPAVAFAAVAAAAMAAGDTTIALFAVCAAVTHVCSAATHVWPDSHAIEKADHLGITATIVGTPVSALMALQHGHAPPGLVAISTGIVGAAFLPPVPRVAGFVVGTAALVVIYGGALLNWVLGTQLALYGAGAALFLRNGGHQRGFGVLSDHHMLHYFVTVASTLHLWDLWRQREAGWAASM